MSLAWMNIIIFVYSFRLVTLSGGISSYGLHPRRRTKSSICCTSCTGERFQASQRFCEFRSGSLKELIARLSVVEPALCHGSEALSWSLLIELRSLRIRKHLV